MTEGPNEPVGGDGRERRLPFIDNPAAESPGVASPTQDSAILLEGKLYDKNGHVHSVS